MDADPHELVNLAGDPKYAKCSARCDEHCQSGNAKRETLFPTSSAPMSSTARPASRCPTGCVRGQ